MEDIHKTIEQQFEQLEIDTLYEILNEKSDWIKAQSLFLRALVIRIMITYLQGLHRTGNIETQYTMRIKGSCLMALYLCRQLGYLSEEQIKQYDKIITR